MFKKIITYARLELSLWSLSLLKYIPGITGSLLRRSLVKNKGSKLMIWEGVTLEYASNLTVGHNVSINRGSFLNCAGGISIGDNVLIGPSVIIYSQNHLYKDRNTLVCQQGYKRKAVVIGNDVWLAADVKVMPGVNISNGCVIAAGAILTKSTEEFGIYAGIPATKIGERKLVNE